jgi:hypothetical protein
VPTLYGVTVSMSVQLVLCALLIVAGGVSILAAAMGNPVRIGAMRVPGPEGAVERAVIGVIGAVCVAAVLPVVLMNQGPGGEPYPVADQASSPGPAAVALPSASPSPTPPVGPSAVVATPGVPTVTSIAVGQDAASGCLRTFSATVHISAGPVTVRYRVYVNGAVVGDPNRTRTVNGTGARLLDNVAVTATHSGAWTVRVDVLGPNPGILTGTAVWAAPAACDPAPPPTTPPPPPAPTLAVSVDLPSNYSGDCTTLPPQSITGHIIIGAGPTPTVTYHLLVDNVTVATAQVSQTAVVPYPAAFGAHTVSLDATSPDTNPTTTQPAGGSYTITCTPPSA